MHAHPPCKQHCSSHNIVLFKLLMDVHMIDASVPFPATTIHVEPMEESKRWNTPSRMTPPERGLHCTLSHNHLSCKSGWPTVIAMQDHPHLLRCSAAYRMHVHIVDWLLGSMFTNGSGRTADLLYAEVMLCILLIYPLQPGRGRIICKHNKKVYNKDV